MSDTPETEFFARYPERTQEAWMHFASNMERQRNELLEALEALFDNEHVDPSDMIYDVRERECLGWDGPSVKQWSDAIKSAKEAIAKAKGQTP